MECRSIRLVVVPTNGFDKYRPPMPSQAGEKRMNIAACLLILDARKYICFAGGVRGNSTKSEAEAYASLFRTRYPDLASRVFLVSARAKHTAADMVALVEDLKTACQEQNVVIKDISLVSHPAHTRLARMTLRALDPGFVLSELPSGEENPYSWWKQVILNWVTEHDPTWTHSWAGRKLAQIVNANRD